MQQKQSARLRKYIAEPARYRDHYGGFHLTNRDRNILELVYRYRYLEARHIRALIPGSEQQITRRLQGLFHNNYLGRYIPMQRMRLELNPGPPMVAYGLETRGAEALEFFRNMPRESEHMTERVRWNKAHTRRTEWFLEHSVMISEFRCVLELATRQSLDIELVSWEQGNAMKGTIPLPNNRSRPVSVAPDAYFVLDVAGELRHFFLEIDRSTEEHDKITRKYERYWWYLDSAQFRRILKNGKRANVLFVTTGGTRMGNMMKTLRKMPKPSRSRNGGKGRFWFCLENGYSLEDPAAILSPLWRSLSSDKGALSMGGRRQTQ